MDTAAVWSDAAVGIWFGEGLPDNPLLLHRAGGDSVNDFQRQFATDHLRGFRRTL